MSKGSDDQLRRADLCQYQTAASPIPWSPVGQRLVVSPRVVRPGMLRK